MAQKFNETMVSYSRKNVEFVHKLVDALYEKGVKDLWVDFEDIPNVADWLEKIKTGIDSAYSFLFVISPDSIASDVCNQEVEYARESNKRIIPILYEEVGDKDLSENMHGALKRHNWIMYEGEDKWDHFVTQVIDAIRTDLEHRETHTDYLLKAREWNANKRKPYLLLHGPKAIEGLKWLKAAQEKDPAPTDLQNKFIRRSVKERRLGGLMNIITNLLIISVLPLFFVGMTYISNETYRPTQYFSWRINDLEHILDSELDDNTKLNQMSDQLWVFKSVEDDLQAYAEMSDNVNRIIVELDSSNSTEEKLSTMSRAVANMSTVFDNNTDLFSDPLEQFYQYAVIFFYILIGIWVLAIIIFILRRLPFGWMF